MGPHVYLELLVYLLTNNLAIPLNVSKVRGTLGAHCLRAGADILRGLRDAEGLAIHRQVQVISLNC